MAEQIVASLRRLTAEVQELQPKIAQLAEVNDSLVAFNGSFGSFVNALAANRKCTVFGGETEASATFPRPDAAPVSPVSISTAPQDLASASAPPSAIPRPSSTRSNAASWSTG